MTERTEVRDGMRIDWDVPITMDDGLVLRADVFRPIDGGALSGHPHLRALRERARVPGRLPERVAAHGRRASRRRGAARRNNYQSWEVVDPEKWVPDGYVCVRVDSRGAGRSPGFIDPFSPRETQDFYHCIEWAGVQPWSQRQGRAERHLLLRHQPVARRVAAAAASRRDVRLGRRGRLVPRHDAPRRHPLHVLGQLVRHAGEDRAVRRWASAARAAACTGELVCGDETLLGRRAGERTAATSATRSSRIRSTTTITRRARRSGTRSRCRCSRRRTGAGRACIRAATSRASCAPPRRRNGSKRTASSTGRTSTPTTAASCRSASSTTSSRARTPAGTSSRGAAAGAPSGREVRRARTRTNGRSRARTGRSSTSIRRRRLDSRSRPARGERHVRRARRGRHVPDARRCEAETEITGPIAAQAVRLVLDRPTPICSWCCACSRPTCSEVVFHGRDRSAHADRAGLAARLAPQARPEALDALPALSHPRREAAARSPAKPVELDIELWPT